MTAQTDTRDLIQKIYIGYYGRAGDPAGLEYWAGRSTAGMSNAAIANSFSVQTESTTMYTYLAAPSLGFGQAAFLESVYQNLFERSIDSSGATYWAAQLDAGRAVGGIILDIINGATNSTLYSDLTTIANKLEVANYYTEKVIVNNATWTSADDAADATSVLASVTSVAETVTTAKASVLTLIAADVAVAGTTFTLTTSTDSGSGFAGGAGSDTFNATNTAGTAAAQTFTTDDVLSGGAGTDTLNITVGAASTYTMSGVSGIEVVNGNFSAAGTLSATGSSGITSLYSKSSTAAAIFTNIASTSVELGVMNTATDATFTFATAAVAGTTDSATLTLSTATAGTVTVLGAETLNIASTGGANALTALVATQATAINISGDTTLNLGTANTVARTIISTNTAGVTLITNAGAVVTVTGGAGNDSITITGGAAESDSISGGAGNDTLTFTADLDTGDTVAGGDGTDTLVALSADLAGATYSLVSGIEAITVSDAIGATLTTENIQAGIATVNFSTAFASNTVTMAAGAKTISQLLAAASAQTMTISDTGTATTDSLTLTNKSAATNVYAAEILAITGYETVTISGNTTTAASATQTFGTITVTPDSGGAVAINFTGNNAITTGIITATSATAGVIDASGMTGAATFANTGATVGITSITGTANADTLVGSATATTLSGGGGIDNITGGAAADSISGGAGNDVINGAAGNDTILGEDGNDSITSGAGNDSITAGAGNDTIVMAADYTTGDVIDGGDGTADVLKLTTAGLTVVHALSISAITALNTNLSNVERLNVSDAVDVGAAFDMARLDSINHITLAAAFTGDEEISGLASGSTVVVNTAPNASADILTLTLGDATGTADALTYTMTQAATADYGVLAVTGTETLNLSANEATASDTVRIATLGLNITTASAGTTVNISGTESVTIDTVIAAQTITSTTTGTFIMTNTTGSGLSQTITSGSGADSIYGGGGADTIDAGAGADSITGGTGIDSITGGTGADTIVGSSGNDIIILTEATASVDDVVINYSEAGLYIDAVTGFTTTSTGDEIQLSLGALETAGTSGVHSSTVNFQALNANTDASEGAATVQVMTTAAAAASAAVVFVLSGSTFSSLAEVEDAIETGGSYQIGVSVTDAHVLAADAFIVVWTDGSSAHVSSVRVVTDPSTNGVFAVAGVTAVDLVTLAGVASISSTTFAAGNFEWVT